MLRQSDPKVQQYTEVQFPSCPRRFFLRYIDTDMIFPWNSTLWYEMYDASWIKHSQDTCDLLEEHYQLCLKQS